MSNFLHFTIAVEYTNTKRWKAGEIDKIANEIYQSLHRHADVVAVDKNFEAVSATAKHRVLPIHEQPEMRDHHGWHVHDNDGACTPCVRLYEHIHPETL